DLTVTGVQTCALPIYLCLHHPDLAAELLRRLDRFVDAQRRKAARRRHAVLAEDLFPLVFVDFHAAFPLNHFGYQTRTVSLVVSRSEERRVGKECRSRW